MNAATQFKTRFERLAKLYNWQPVAARKPLDESVVKALVKRGFRPEQVQKLYLAGRLSIV